MLKKILLTLLNTSILTLSLQAAPPSDPTYEPVLKNDPTRANLLWGAKTTASGHWGNDKPENAINDMTTILRP
jgi:hypothetical protein